ncbi:MAG: metal ABC transporter permease [Anaerolineales bacterium]
MMFVAVLIASFSGLIGLYLSYYFSLASGGVIVLTTTLIFLLVWAWRNVRRRNT